MQILSKQYSTVAALRLEFCNLVSNLAGNQIMFSELGDEPLFARLGFAFLLCHLYYLRSCNSGFQYIISSGCFSA